MDDYFNDDYFNIEGVVPANRSAAEGDALMQPENCKSAFDELSAEQQEAWTVFYYNELKPRIDVAMLNQSRQKYCYQKGLAADAGAITSLQDGCLAFFSRKDLTDAFAPERIAKIGSLPADAIVPETGAIRRTEKIESISALDIPYRAYAFLNAVIANSIHNNITVPITFYVKGVLNSLNIKPRISSSGTNNKPEGHLCKKDTGAVYLERLFRPLLNHVGLLPDGSRFPVLIYKGYDARTGTMTVSSPYLGRLWHIVHTEYKFRDDNRRKTGRKKTRPLEINCLFRKEAIKADETTLEIAVYLTNVLLRSGKSKKWKTTSINYKTLIEYCPRLSEILSEIDREPSKRKIFDADGKPTGKTKNNTARFNGALKKIGKAVELILNPEKCSATELYELSFSPSEVRGGKSTFIPPTKSRLNEKIIIRWRSITL